MEMRHDLPLSGLRLDGPKKLLSTHFGYTWTEVYPRGVSIVQVARWGNSLAVRLPADLVRELGLKEGDKIDLVKDDGQVKVRRLPRAEEVLAGLRRLRGRLAAADRLSRDDAHER